MTFKTFAAGLAFAALAVAAPAAANAQANYNGVRVMIAADDADPKSVIRSSDIYHRLQIPLNEEMKRYGYTAIFEDAMTAELGWEVPDRASKQKTLELSKNACTSNKNTLCPRVVILVKTRASAVDLGYGTKAQVRMTGELIDANTNTYLGGWEAPTQTFPAPKACSNVCLEDVVGDHSREVALNLADTLRRMLDQQALRQTASASSGGGAVTGGQAPARSGGGLVNNYEIVWEHFDMQEIIPMKTVIENEFPDMLDCQSVNGTSGFFKVNCASRAKGGKMVDWIHLMLEDLGYNLSNVKVQADGQGKITIDRVVDDGYRPARPGRAYR